MRWSDVAQYATWADTRVHDGSMQGIMSSNALRGRNRTRDLSEVLRGQWNDPKSSKSPYRYTHGMLKPVRVDEHGDTVYRYDPGYLDGGEDE